MCLKKKKHYVNCLYSGINGSKIIINNIIIIIPQIRYKYIVMISFSFILISFEFIIDLSSVYGHDGCIRVVIDICFLYYYA